MKQNEREGGGGDCGFFIHFFFSTLCGGEWYDEWTIGPDEQTTELDERTK